MNRRMPSRRTLLWLLFVVIVAAVVFEIVYPVIRGARQQKRSTVILLLPTGYRGLVTVRKSDAFEPPQDTQVYRVVVGKSGIAYAGATAFSALASFQFSASYQDGTEIPRLSEVGSPTEEVRRCVVWPDDGTSTEVHLFVGSEAEFNAHTG